MVPEKDADDHLKSSPSDINTNAINMSQTHNSVQHGSMKDIETQVGDDEPGEHNHTIPERKESVVAEKGADEYLKSSPSDVNANDINMS